MTCYDLYQKALQTKGFSAIIKELNIVSGTAKRWESLQNVPEQYKIDLMRLCEIPIDYSQLSAREKDQFFTPEKTAENCIDILYNIIEENGIDINEYIFIEPSAGKGVFLNYLPENTLAFDIEKFDNRVQVQDFFTWQPEQDKKYIVVGNPPFGLRGQKALKFINKSLTFADFCAFILPPLFDSDGRGTPKKRINGNLLYTGQCDSKYNYPDGTATTVATIFQIWTSLKNLGEEIKPNEKPIGFQIYSLSDGGTPGSTRNKDKLYICDYYLPSTCFGENNVHLYDNFEDLPQRRGYGIIVSDNTLREKIQTIDWSKISFYSTNGASNLRSSLIINAINN